MKSQIKALVGISAAAFLTTAIASDDFTNLDANQDGMISKEEFQDHQGVVDAWVEIDTDQDDQVSQDEFNALNANADLTARTGWDRRSNPPDGALDSEFSTLDVDQDGMLSQDELVDHPGVVEYWSDIDIDADNYLSTDEFDSFSHNDDLTSKTGWDRRQTPPEGADG